MDMDMNMNTIQKIDHTTPQRTKQDTYKDLETDVLHLKHSMDILRDLVEEQQQPLDTIEQCIAESKQSIHQGATSLEAASDWSSWTSTYVVGGMVLAMYVLL